MSAVSSAAITACLASRAAIGGRSATVWASAIASSSHLPFFATVLTRPIACAVSASKRRPVST